MSLEVVLGELTRARSLAFEAADSLEGVAYVPSTGSEATFGSPVLASAAQAFCLELEDVVRGHAARAEQTAEALGAAAADYARADQEVETQVGALAGGLGTVAPGSAGARTRPTVSRGPVPRPRRRYTSAWPSACVVTSRPRARTRPTASRRPALRPRRRYTSVWPSACVVTSRPSLTWRGCDEHECVGSGGRPGS